MAFIPYRETLHCLLPNKNFRRSDNPPGAGVAFKLHALRVLINRLPGTLPQSLRNSTVSNPQFSERALKVQNRRGV